jgi:hypothetical protein
MSAIYVENRRLKISQNVPANNVTRSYSGATVTAFAIAFNDVKSCFCVFRVTQLHFAVNNRSSSR